MVQGHMIETFFCTSPILQLHAWRTGEAGKSNAQKVGYAKILYTFKKPQYSFLLFHCKHDLGGIRTLLQLRHPLHNPRPLLLQQVKARTGGAEGGGHMARQGRVKRAQGEVPNSWSKVFQTGNSKLIFRYFYSLQLWFLFLLD